MKGRLLEFRSVDTARMTRSGEVLQESRMADMEEQIRVLQETCVRSMINFSVTREKE